MIKTVVLSLLSVFPLTGDARDIEGVLNLKAIQYPRRFTDSLPNILVLASMVDCGLGRTLQYQTSKAIAQMCFRP